MYYTIMVAQHIKRVDHVKMDLENRIYCGMGYTRHEYDRSSLSVYKIHRTAGMVI